MGRAIWRDLVVGFAAQLGELNLGFTQLAALYVLADSGTMTVADLADTLGRSPSAVSRMVDGLVKRQLLERRQDSEDRRQRTLTLTGRGPRAPGNRGPGTRPGVPGDRQTAAHCRTCRRRDGRGGPIDPRDLPTRSPDQAAAGEVRSAWNAGVDLACRTGQIGDSGSPRTPRASPSLSTVIDQVAFPLPRSTTA